MLQVKYYKDYRHNYLIVKCKDGQDTNAYQRKMITVNPIKGLLKCQERHINGELLLYYEITSRQSLASIYGERSVGIETLRQFFMQLKLVSDMLQKYLLDTNGLVFRPEYIFQDLETKELSYLYYPGEQEGDLSGLMEFFMEKVDDENEKAVEIVYKVADLIHRDQFVLDEVLEYLQEYMEEEPLCQKQVLGEIGNIDEATASISMTEEKQWNEEENMAADKEKWPLLFLGLGLFGMCMLIYIMQAYYLEYTGKLLLAAGWSVMVLLLAGAAFGYIRRIYSYKKKVLTEDRKNAYCEQVTVSEYDMPNIPVSEQGNTVFIPWTENCENRLYGMNKGNKYHIDLGRLPLTVGKLAGAVDMVINEQGISRMHAKFSRVGGKICVTDLNSTNGTFKNGLRLQPNDSEIIEPGDEIRLGKLNFIYR